MYTHGPATSWTPLLADPVVATDPGSAAPTRALRKLLCSSAQLQKVNQILGKELRADELQGLLQQAVDGAASLARGGALPLVAQRAALFEAVFGLTPTWHPAGAQWVLGGVIRKRMRLAAGLLSGGSLLISCLGWPWGDLGPDSPESYFVRATENKYRIGLGTRFWEAVRDQDTESTEGGLLAAALKIAFGDLIRFRPEGATKNLAVCYLRYALHVAGRKIPGWFGDGCPIPPARWDRLMPSPAPSSQAEPAPASSATKPLKLRLTDEELERILGGKPADPLSARIDWIISQVPPTPAARPPLKDLLRKALDERLDQVMNRTGVPKRLQPYIRKAAHGAVERGSKLVLEESLNQLGVTDPTVVKAIGGVVDRVGEESP